MPRKTHVFLAAAATAAALLAAGSGGSGSAGNTAGSAGRTGTGGTSIVNAAGGNSPVHSHAVQVKAAATPSPTSATPTTSPTTSSPVDPGTLPQTQALPTDQDTQFQAGAKALWQAIVQDKPELARAFFFPLSAYRQVKAISNPDADYQDRLIAWYGLDIKAAHDHLGSAAAGARFVSMTVPAANAEWIEPGAEYNKGSYYRVYGTRLNYRTGNGHDASIGVFSLISWRGEWYVVHLGPSTRSSTEGIVYDPWN